MHCASSENLILTFKNNQSENSRPAFSSNRRVIRETVRRVALVDELPQSASLLRETDESAFQEEKNSAATSGLRWSSRRVLILKTEYETVALPRWQLDRNAPQKSCLCHRTGFKTPTYQV